MPVESKCGKMPCAGQDCYLASLVRTQTGYLTNYQPDKRGTINVKTVEALIHRTRGQLNNCLKPDATNAALSEISEALAIFESRK